MRSVRVSACIVLLSLQAAWAQNWEQVGGGLSGYPRGMHVLNETLIVAKNITSGADSALLVLQENGWQRHSAWCPNGLTGTLFEYGGNLVCSSDCGIAIHVGDEWQQLATNAARGFGHYQGDLIAVGWFDSIAGIPASKVARWDGSAWHAFDTTVWEGGAISCAIEYQGDLYVGGNMIDGELDIDRIGRWDGTQWHKVGNGIRGGVGTVSCFAIYEGDLYMGGWFTADNGNPGPNIARWDGEQWKDVGGGLQSSSGGGCEVRDMVVFNGDLYAVGQCAYAGGIPAHKIARWDGSEWCGFGDVFNNNISALAVHQGELYMGGAFTTINNDTVLRVAKWTGGDFVEVCGSLTGVEDVEPPLPALNVNAYPNPTDGSLTLQVDMAGSGRIHVNLFGMTGQHLSSDDHGMQHTSFTTEVDMGGFPSGIYFVQVIAGMHTVTKKIIKHR